MKKLNVIGNGVVVDPIAFFSEIDYLKEEGVKVTPEKLIVSDRAHVIMPYHKVLDKLKEKARGKMILELLVKVLDLVIQISLKDVV